VDLELLVLSHFFICLQTNEIEVVHRLYGVLGVYVTTLQYIIEMIENNLGLASCTISPPSMLNVKLYYTVKSETFDIFVAVKCCKKVEFLVRICCDSF